MAPPALGEYQIGWICALPVEMAAAREMLDEDFGILTEQDNADPNIYTLGRINQHYIVIACLGGSYGITSATIAACNMIRTFSRSLKIGLMVGIGGGIPSPGHDIRLGDIVISYPTGTCGGVVQHDMGKMTDDGQLTRIGSLNSPPRLLLAAVEQMRAAAMREDPVYPSLIEKVIQRNTRTGRNFSPPGPPLEHDRLFQIQYQHPPDEATCDHCLPAWEVNRDHREDSIPQPHFGVIASGNAVIKDGRLREKLWRETGALCVEMEAAGLMQDFPCIVIRGISHYADSHENKQWQGYAALVAAAYTKELLGYLPRGYLSQEKRSWDTVPQTTASYSDSTSSTHFPLDGRVLVSGSADCTIKLCDPSTGILHQTLDVSSPVNNIAFPPESKLLASSGGNTLKLWQLRTGQLHRAFDNSTPGTLAFSPDGGLLAVSSDKIIELWDVSSGQLCRKLKDHTFGVTSIAFSPDGRRLASTSSDGTIWLWDHNTGELLQKLRESSETVESLAFTPEE